MAWPVMSLTAAYMMDRLGKKVKTTPGNTH